MHSKFSCARTSHAQLKGNITSVLYCIVYRYLYSASHGVSQTEALSVHFSSRKKVRLKEREMRKGEQRE